MFLYVFYLLLSMAFLFLGLSGKNLLFLGF